MDSNIVIALVGALINIILSVVIPCIFKKSENDIVNDVKKVYAANRQLILSSSIIIGITIYLALEFTPQLKEVFDNLIDSSDSSESSDMSQIVRNNWEASSGPFLIASNLGPQLGNLARLI